MSSSSGEGDIVIFSSRIIPGNEIAIGRIMNQLSELGVEMVTERQAHVHVSGHPGRPELVQMYKWMRPADRRAGPRRAAPHAPSMRGSRCRTAFRKAIVQKNGDVIRLAPGEPEKIDEVRVGRLVLDGDVILPADGATINERRRIGYGGLITVALPVDRHGRLAGAPLVRPFGMPVEEDRDDFIADATDAASRAYSAGRRRGGCARRCASPSAAARPCGPARSRSSTSRLLQVAR